MAMDLEVLDRKAAGDDEVNWVTAIFMGLFHVGAIAALFFAHLLRTGSAAEALARATSSVFGILRRTAAAGARELLLIEAQDEIVAPSEIFRPETL